MDTLPQDFHRKLLDEHPLLVLPSLAVALGLNQAILLQQIHFLLQISKHIFDGRKWVYNTYEQWQTHFPFWAPRTLRYLLTDLEGESLLLSANYNTSKADRTKWYAILYENIDKHLSHVTNLDSPCDKFGQSMWQKVSVHVAESVSSDQRLSSEIFPSDLCSKDPSGLQQVKLPQKSRSTPPKMTPTSLVWDAYAHAYHDRYGTPPVRNAKVNAQMKQFVQRVPQEEAPHIAAFYVWHASAYYQTKGHPIGLLLADAEKLHTEWKTNRPILAPQARQQEKTASNPFLPILERLQQEAKHHDDQR